MAAVRSSLRPQLAPKWSTNLVFVGAIAIATKSCVAGGGSLSVHDATHLDSLTAPSVAVHGRLSAPYMIAPGGVLKHLVGEEGDTLVAYVPLRHDTSGVGPVTLRGRLHRGTTTLFGLVRFGPLLVVGDTSSGPVSPKRLQDR